MSIYTCECVLKFSAEAFSGDYGNAVTTDHREHPDGTGSEVMIIVAT